jgi:hypothetical protein
VKFQLEANVQNIYFELLFFMSELHDLLHCIEPIIISCLCLKSIERDMFQFTITQPLDIIVNCQNPQGAKILLNRFHKANLCLSKVENLTILLIHYNSILVILHKFKSLNITNQQNVTLSIISQK